MATSKARAKKGTDPSRDETHLLREILRTHQVVMAAFLETLGMPLSRVVLMRLLARANDPVGAKELALVVGANVSVVARQLNEMEEDGLVRRRADPADKRRHFVHLSLKGQRVFHEIHARSRELEHALTSRIGAAETRVAAEVLSRLRMYASPKVRTKAPRRERSKARVH